MEATNEPAALTAAEQAMDTLSLEGFNRAADETLSLTDRLMAVMGIKMDQDSGNFIQMTADERFEALPDEERLLFTGLEQQIDRQNKLLAGDIAPSEVLTQRGQRNFDVLKEQQARFGNTITGTGLDAASANSTAGIQSLSALRGEQNLAIDTERRAEIADLGVSIGNRAGLLSNFRSNRVAQLTNLPARHNITGIQNNAGLLRDINFKADQQAAYNLDAGFGEILTRLIP